MFRRSISMMLCICMVLSMMPLSALSAMAEDPAVPAETIAVTELADATIEPETTTAFPASEDTESISDTSGQSARDDVLPDVETESTCNLSGSSDIVAHGMCGDDAYWELDSEGVLTISGTGEMYHYGDYTTNLGTPLWANHAPHIKSIIIQNGITSIGECAFSFYGHGYGYPDNLTSVSIPTSVRTISTHAFEDCRALTSITIPEGVISIGESAFLNCTGLTSIVVPDTVTDLGHAAFAGCTNLTSVTLPDNFTVLGSWFSDCVNLTHIPIHNKITEIDSYAFNNTGVSSVEIPQGVTKIGARAFEECHNLKRIVIPDSVVNIGEYAFSQCTSLTEICLPDSLTTIGDGLFQSCTALTSVSLPSQLTDVSSSTFEGCTNLSEIILPDTVTSIWDNAFGLCSALESIDFPAGLTSIWDNAFIYSGLKNVTILSSVSRISEGAFSDCSALESVTILSDELTIESSAFARCPSLTEIRFTGDAPIFESGYNGCMQFDDDVILAYYPANNPTWKEEVMQDYGGIVTWVAYDSDNPDDPGDNPEDGEYITDLVDNSNIKINSSGQAYAYYQTKPDQKVEYLLRKGSDVSRKTAQADKDGILTIDLGHYSQKGFHNPVIEITKLGDRVCAPHLVFSTGIQVDPLNFSQKWTTSFSANVSRSLINISETENPEEISILEAEAALLKGGLSLGGESAMTISRSYSGGKETLSISNEIGMKGKASITSGVTGKVLNAKHNKFNAGGNASVAVSRSYGIQIDNYSKNNPAQQKAVAAFLLGELLKYGGGTLLQPFHQFLTKDVYKDSSIQTTDGSGGKISTSGSVDVNRILVNDIPIASEKSQARGFSYSFSDCISSNGEYELSTEFRSEADIGSFHGKNGFHGSSSAIYSNLAYEYMGREIEVTSQKGVGEPEVETTFLKAESKEAGTFILGVSEKAHYNAYTLQGKPLEELLDKYPRWSDFVHKDMVPLNLDDLENFGSFVSNSKAPLPYSEKLTEKTIFSIPLDISTEGLSDAGLKLKVEWSGISSTSFTSQSGFAANDNIYYTSKTDAKVEDSVNANLMDLKDVIGNIFVCLANELKTFFKKTTAPIAEGVKDGWSWIKEKTDSSVNWIVSIIRPDDSKTKARSHFISTIRSNAPILSNGIENTKDTNQRSAAMTIGMTFLVEVVDADTKEAIADFGDETLEYTIRYDESDLAAAGLAKDSPSVQDKKIAMYRYCDEGDYFEFIGGENDLEAMTVTAEITRTGQYVLAVDACAPELTELDLSSFGANPTITAYVDDLSGLDLSKFRFVLDGDTVVDGTKVQEHFNTATGKFTYEVTGKGLSEGEHSLSFTLCDTTGNEETYPYTFCVDLTVPVIESYTVTGAANEDAVAEIRAVVSDQHLTHVYAVFSKLLPDGQWSNEVTTEMTQLEDGAWALDYEGDGSTVKVYVLAEDIGGNTVKSDEELIKPFLESLEIKEEYYALRVNQTHNFHAEAAPAEFAAQIKWSTDNADVIEVNEETGEIRAVGVGTAYVIATVTDGENTKTARCRVDVTQALDVKGVQLGTDKTTTELYSTDYAELDVLLMLEQNMDASLVSNEDPQIPDSNSVAIESAVFKDAATAKLFNLVAMDDRRIAIVPTDYAIKNPKEVKGSYKSEIIVTVEGKECTSEVLTLTVKKSMPKLKVTVPAFNSFYSGQEQDLVITGGTAAEIEAVALPEWLTLKGETLSLNEKAPAKSASGKATLKVYTEEWRIPSEISLTVKNTYKAPGVKLSASSVTLAKSDSNGAVLKLVPSGKKDTLTSLNVSGITAPEGYTISGFNATTGEFTLKGNTLGKIILNVSFYGTDKILPLTLTVKTADVKLKLSKSSVTLNKKVTDSAQITVCATPADFALNLTDYRLTDAKGADKKNSGELTVRLNGNKISIATNATTPANATYKLYVSAGGSKEVALTIKTIEKEPTVTFQAKGNLDLSFPNNEATITPAFKNYSGGFTFDKVETENFTLTQDGSTIVAACESDAVPGTYTQKLILTLDDGSTLENTVKIAVKRTAVKLKLSSTKLTLNHKVRDIGEVAVSCTTKGYDFTKPVWALMDKSGKNPADGELNIQWKDGKLVIATNDATNYGATYKLLVRATEADSAVTLTVIIPAENKSAVTATLKAKGSIDVIRDGSAVILTPAYKNVTSQTVKEAKLVFTKTANKVTTNTDDLFCYTANADGTFTITKAEGAKLDHSAKYTVELVATVNGQPIAVKPIALSVKQGSAKLTLTTLNGTLFAMDNQSRGEFVISAADATLNKISRVEIKDAKYDDLFEIFDYEDGTYAIGFKDNKVPAALVGKTVTLNLNVFLKGNETGKANTTVKLKLTIIR